MCRQVVGTGSNLSAAMPQVLGAVTFFGYFSPPPGLGGVTSRMAPVTKDTEAKWTHGLEHVGSHYTFCIRYAVLPTTTVALLLLFSK